MSQRWTVEVSYQGTDMVAEEDIFQGGVEMTWTPNFGERL